MLPGLTSQTVVVYAATKGFMDKVPTSKILEAESAVLKAVPPALLKIIKSHGKITAAVEVRSACQQGRLVATCLVELWDVLPLIGWHS